MMKLNPDREFVSKFTKKLKENDGYCPCAIVKTKDTKCKCKDMREKNICICELYVK